MTMKYGPTRGELKIRLVISLAGLAFIGFALVYRGMGGIAWTEITLISLVFFGASALHAGLKLWQRRRGDE